MAGFWMHTASPNSAPFLVPPMENTSHIAPNSVRVAPPAARALPSRAPSRYSSRPSSSHTFRIAASSAPVYTPPTSVVLLMYTSLGCTICSSGWAAQTARMASGVSLPSAVPGAATHLWPLASMAPVSCTHTWPVVAAITA